MTHSSPVNDALMGKSLAEANRLLQESGYNFEEAHPECYRNFSYVKLFQLVEADRIRAQQTASEAPRFYIVNQHIGWLKQYILGMDEKNWRDMQLRAERQLESLSEEIDKEEAALGIRAQCVLWQPIETAPRDGTIVDLWLTGGGRVTDQWWEDEDKTWCGLEDEMFTNWAPIPAFTSPESQS